MSTSNFNQIDANTGYNYINASGTAYNYILSATTNLMSATTSNTMRSVGTNYITGTTNGSNEITANGTGTNKMTSATTNTLTATTSNTLSSGGTNFITGTTNGSNEITANGTGTSTITTSSGKNLISSTSGIIELKTGAGTETGINIENTNVTDGGITLKSNAGDINLVATSLKNNGQTINPQRSYNIDYRNGGTSASYGIEIIRAADDPNTLLTDPTNSATYIEILTKSNLASGYNNQCISGYFRSGGDSDMVTTIDILNSQYINIEQHIAGIYSGGNSSGYISFIFYLVGGFEYRIITNGTLGNYWNNITTTPTFEKWILTNNITYAPIAGTTFAIVKVADTGVDFIGVTANTSLLLKASLLNNGNIYQTTTAKELNFRMSNTKLLSKETYIGTPATGIVPIVNFTLVGQQRDINTVNTTPINWKLPSTNTSNSMQYTRIPFNCRVVGIMLTFNNTFTSGAPQFMCRVTWVSSTAGSSTSSDILIPAGEINQGGSGYSNPQQNTLTHIAGDYFTAQVSYFTDATATTPYVLTAEYTITFYFQQLP